MKQTISALILIFISCTGFKKETQSEPENLYTKAYTLAEIEEGLSHIIGSKSKLVMLPKKEYVYELGHIATGTFLFDYYGEKIKFDICLSDYPSPLTKNIRYLNNPKKAGNEILEEFILKLDNHNKHVLQEGDYDFILFYVWNMSRHRKHDEKIKKFHYSLNKDVENLNKSGKSIRLVHLYVGNFEAYQLNPDTFLSQKIKYANDLIKSGKRT